MPSGICKLCSGYDLMPSSSRVLARSCPLKPALPGVSRGPLVSVSGGGSVGPGCRREAVCFESQPYDRWRWLSSISACAIARTSAPDSSLAASSVSSTATRAPGPIPRVTKSIAIASSKRAWCGWSYGTTAVVRSNHPCSPLPAPLQPTISTIEVHIAAPPRSQLLRQVLLAEREHLLPAVERLLDAVGRAVVIEKAVAGAVIAMELVVIAGLLQLGLGLVDLFRGRGAGFVAEETEQWARQAAGQGYRRHRLLRRQLVLPDAAAPQLDRAIDALLYAG